MFVKFRKFHKEKRVYHIHLQEFTIYYERKKEKQQSRYINGERQYGRLFPSVY